MKRHVPPPPPGVRPKPKHHPAKVVGITLSVLFGLCCCGRGLGTLVADDEPTPAPSASANRIASAPSSVSPAPTLALPARAERVQSPGSRWRIGLDLSISRLLVVDWMPAHVVWSDALMFILDGGQLDDDQAEALKPTDNELTNFCFLPYEEAVPHLRPSMARRVGSALHALAEGQPRYAEFGRS